MPLIHYCNPAVNCTITLSHVLDLGLGKAKMDVLLQKAIQSGFVLC